MVVKREICKLTWITTNGNHCTLHAIQRETVHSVSIATFMSQDFITILPPLLVGNWQGMAPYHMHMVKRATNKRIMWDLLANSTTYLANGSANDSSHVCATITTPRNGVNVFFTCCPGRHGNMINPCNTAAMTTWCTVEHLANKTMAWYSTLPWPNAMSILF